MLPGDAFNARGEAPVMHPIVGGICSISDEICNKLHIQEEHEKGEPGLPFLMCISTTTPDRQQSDRFRRLE